VTIPIVNIRIQNPMTIPAPPGPPGPGGNGGEGRRQPGQGWTDRRGLSTQRARPRRTSGAARWANGSTRRRWIPWTKPLTRGACRAGRPGS
jgi:hypothetical protein